MAWTLDERHKPNHNSYALCYHLVFVTRKREPLIDQPMAEFLQHFFFAKCEEMGSTCWPRESCVTTCTWC